MPRTLAENATYIAETIKPAIKQAIEDKGVSVPSGTPFVDYADYIGDISGGGSGYQLKDLPTGSISTVNDAAELPLNALKVSVEAWQEGSGDPSPSNVRPIHGWDSGEITVCDDIQSPTQTKTYTLDFPQTIYGAEWDVVSGGMKQAKGALDLGTKTWTAHSTAGRFYFHSNASDNIKNTSQSLPLADAMCSSYQVISQTALSTGVTGISADNSSLPYINVYDANCINMTAAQFKEYVSGVIFKYPLATPTPIDLSPLSIRLLQGTNNVYADCGEVLEGEYFVDAGAIDVRKVDYSIGSNSALKISDGRILQGFANMASCHSRPLDNSGNWLDVDWSKDFEIGVAFKFTAFPAYQSIFGDGNANSYRKAPRIYYDNSEGKLALCVSSDGSTLAIDTYLNHTFAVDKWYFIKAKFVLSTMTFTVDISDDFNTFTNLYTGIMSNAPYHNTASLSLGGEAQQSNMASNTFLIDTFNTYIKGDGVNWGAFTGVFPS